MPDSTAASEAARNLVRSRWDKLTPEQRKAQTAPATAARLAKRAERERARRLAGQPVEPVTGTVSYKDALVAVVAQADYLNTEQKTLLAAQLRDAVGGRK